MSRNETHRFQSLVRFARHWKDSEPSIHCSTVFHVHTDLLPSAAAAATTTTEMLVIESAAEAVTERGRDGGRQRSPVTDGGIPANAHPASVVERDGLLRGLMADAVGLLGGPAVVVGTLHED